MKTRLPILAQQSVSEAQAHRQEVSQAFEARVRVDAARERQPLTCTRGCDSCCYLPVMSTVLEGVSLHRWLVTHHHWKDSLKQRLKEHLGRVQRLPLDTWSQAMIPCPFLDEHLCTIYEGRPYACRTTFSTGDPLYCHPHELGPQTRFVDRNAVNQVIQMKETQVLHRHSAPFLFLPLSGAILIGQRLNDGDLVIEDLGVAMKRILHG